LGGASALRQIIRLDAASDCLVFDAVLDWRERRTLLKAVFPVDCRAPRATYETMYGAVERPTHANTDSDLAQYEAPGHRWADLSEPGFGVSLITDCLYGYSVFDNLMTLSLARGPVIPDPHADIGEHRFAYALYPHVGDWRVAGTVGLACRFNRPVLWAPGAPAPILAAPPVKVDRGDVVVDTLKPAEDGEGWIARLYEPHGARTAVRLAFGVPVNAAWISNTLEDRLEPVALDDGALNLEFGAFQIVTLRLA
jgi:alpha-mannosidase